MPCTGARARLSSTPPQPRLPAQAGKLDPSLPITHCLPLSEAPLAYRAFNDKEEGWVKVVFVPGMDRRAKGADSSGS